MMHRSVAGQKLLCCSVHGEFKTVCWWVKGWHNNQSRTCASACLHLSSSSGNLLLRWFLSHCPQHWHWSWLLSPTGLSLVELWQRWRGSCQTRSWELLGESWRRWRKLVGVVAVESHLKTQHLPRSLVFKFSFFLSTYGHASNLKWSSPRDWSEQSGLPVCWSWSRPLVTQSFVGREREKENSS